MSSYSSDSEDDDPPVRTLGSYQIAAASDLTGGGGSTLPRGSKRIPGLYANADDLGRLTSVKDKLDVNEVVKWSNEHARRRDIMEANPYYQFACLVASQLGYADPNSLFKTDQDWLPRGDEDDTTAAAQRDLLRVMQKTETSGRMNFNAEFEGNVTMSMTDLRGRLNFLSKSARAPSVDAIITRESDTRAQFARLVATNINHSRLRSGRQIRLQVDYDRAVAEKKACMDALAKLIMSKNKNYI